MNYRRVAALLLGIIFLGGCAANQMVEYKPAASTGAMTQTVYSKYYDAGDWLIEGKVGVTFIVDHDHKRMPVVPEWMDPKSSDAQGRLFVELHNFTEKSIHVEISGVKLNQVAISGHTGGDLKPFATTAVELGVAPIFNYATALNATVVFATNEGVIEKNPKLVRRTNEEMEKYFAPGKTPPYPFADYRKLLRH